MSQSTWDMMTPGQQAQMRDAGRGPIPIAELDEERGKGDDADEKYDDSKPGPLDDEDDDDEDDDLEEFMGDDEEDDDSDD